MGRRISSNLIANKI